MVCGTTSDAGKTTIVAGLCRSLARRGVRVAPFKAQNMALNSVVTRSGHEIGRAQGMQAHAAGIEPDVAMNPILLKPTGERTSQVVVNGVPWKVLDAAEYHEAKAAAAGRSCSTRWHDLRGRFDVVLCEGAGSPAEINLLDHDLVNLRLADEPPSMPAIVVGDINLGGVFAALYGTVALLPDELPCLRARVRDQQAARRPTLARSTAASSSPQRTGVPVVGVVPWLRDTGLDAEDSMALALPRPCGRRGARRRARRRGRRAARASPTSPTSTPSGSSPACGCGSCTTGRRSGRPDLVIVPGSKATVDDLRWMRTTGLADRVAATDAVVLGICGGYQMLGHRIVDDVESGAGELAGLGLLPVRTTFAPDKVTALRNGTALGHAVDGYQIHHGRVQADDGGEAVARRSTTADGASEVDGVTLGDRFGTTRARVVRGRRVPPGLPRPRRRPARQAVRERRHVVRRARGRPRSTASPTRSTPISTCQRSSGSSRRPPAVVTMTGARRRRSPRCRSRVSYLRCSTDAVAGQDGWIGCDELIADPDACGPRSTPPRPAGSPTIRRWLRRCSCRPTPSASRASPSRPTRSGSRRRRSRRPSTAMRIARSRPGEVADLRSARFADRRRRPTGRRGPRRSPRAVRRRVRAGDADRGAPAVGQRGRVARHHLPGRRARPGRTATRRSATERRSSSPPPPQLGGSARGQTIEVPGALGWYWDRTSCCLWYQTSGGPLLRRLQPARSRRTRAPAGGPS